MAKVIKALVEGYHFMNTELSDPRTQSWFLIGNPLGIIFLLGSYLYFVKSLGPRLMENVQPFRIEKIMMIFNAFQIVANIYILERVIPYLLLLSFFLFGCRLNIQFICVNVVSFWVIRRCLNLAWWNGYSWKCEPMDYSDSPRSLEIANAVWLYFMIKITDLVDTVFFVMRKKYSHISFLHVYHHAGMVLGTWGATKYVPGGHLTFLGLINSFVHIIMYTYYLLSIINPEYKKSVWWKKHITQLQMAQFLMITIHASQLLFREYCGYPKWIAFLIVPQNFFMFVLFYDFYRKAYSTKAKSE